MLKYKKMRTLLKTCLIAFPLSVALYASPITENSSSGEWDVNNKAKISRGEVLLGGKAIFKVERLGNVAFLSLPKKPTPIERSFWKIEVHNDGHSFFADWDNKKGAWKFNLTSSGVYDIYISKNKSNLDKISYAWFSLSY